MAKPKQLKGQSWPYLLAGVIVLSQTEGDQLVAEMSALRKPIDPVWAEYNGLIRKLENVNDRYRDYPGELFTRRAKIEAAIAEWKANHPEHATELRIKDLENQAEYQERLAKNAMRFDADGWIYAAGQQTNHDESMAKADSIRAEIQKIKAGQ
jgi:hypothetical protein